MPGLIVSDEGFYLCQFQTRAVYAYLFFQDALGCLVRVFQMMEVIVGQEPSLLTIGTYFVFHEESGTVVQGCNVSNQGVLVTIQGWKQLGANPVNRTVLRIKERRKN